MSKFIVDRKSVNHTPDCIADLKRRYDEYGVLVIRDAFTPEAYSYAAAQARAAFETDVTPQLVETDKPDPKDDIFKIASNSTQWKTGIIGNAGFGYLFAQPEKREEAHTLELDGKLKVFFAMGSGYKANIGLVTHHTSEEMLDILLAVTGNEVGMISQDSCKVHRGPLTDPHADVYHTNEDQINRSQAIAFGPREGNVRLCFAVNSHTTQAQHDITKIIEKNIYKTSGFQKIPTDKTKQVMKYFNENTSGVTVYAGAPRDLVIWKPKIIHFEALKKGNQLEFRNDNKTTVERYILGTQTPVGLTQQQLKEVAFVAEYGFIFHPYNNLNANTAIGNNSVHLKKTQYKKTRTVCADEKQRFDKVKKSVKRMREYESGDGSDIEEFKNFDQFIESLGPLKKKAYGIQ